MSVLEVRTRMVSDFYVGDVEIRLTRQERAVLGALHDAAGAFVSRAQIIALLGCERTSKLPDVLIHHIRDKLSDHGISSAIESEPSRTGKGWRWAL